MRLAIGYGTLWTLRRNGRIAQADVREIEGVGIELRYTWDGELMFSRVFRDGADLLKEAAQICTSWSPLISWLRQVDSLRRVA
jgi:hypothetical protein